VAVTPACNVDGLQGGVPYCEIFELGPGLGGKACFSCREIDFQQEAVLLGMGVVQAHQDKEQGEEEFDGVIMFHIWYFFHDKHFLE
jgi:hypothetical protein